MTESDTGCRTVYTFPVTHGSLTLQMRLTNTVINRATYVGNDNRQYILWDDVIPGFGLRVYPTGRKSFVLSYRANRRKRLYTIGPYGVLTLKQARERAKLLLASVLDGQDPAKDRQLKAKERTFSELCDAYLEQHAKVHKKTWKEDERRINKCLRPRWQTLRVSAIDQHDVVLLHHEIGKRHPYEANRTVELLKSIYAKAMAWGYLPRHHDNPTAGITLFKEEKRDRWLTGDEMPRVAEAIAAEANVYVQAAIWLYLFTGVRKSELLNAQWADVDLDRGELRLPDTKSGRTHYVSLSLPAIELLSRVPRIAGNPYVLPGHKAAQHLVNIDKPWQRIRNRAACDDVRLHDLRRTVGSWLAQSGNSLHLIGRILNHQQSSTTEVYARFAQNHLREALDRHGQQILDTAGKSDFSDLLSQIPE